MDTNFGEELYNLLQTGNCVDVNFSVNSNTDDPPVKIPAHKIILMTSSSIFATMMTTQESTPGDVIIVPEKFSVDAVELFVKVGSILLYLLTVVFLNVKYVFSVFFFSVYILSS
jgi:hypothetical protein